MDGNAKPDFKEMKFTVYVIDASCIVCSFLILHSEVNFDL